MDAPQRGTSRFCCPRPTAWAQVHRELLRVWRAQGGNADDKPPVPLILAGWAFSSPLEKHIRWLGTVEWAAAHGCEHITASVAPTDLMAWGEVGPGWSPPSYARHAPKPRPTEEAVAAALRTLEERWSEIAGPGLAAITRPREFSGRKCRRLVVLADGAGKPAWGSWHYLERSRRHHFSEFRRRVNAAIHPLEVDHIDFKVVRQLEGWADAS